MVTEHSSFVTQDNNHTYDNFETLYLDSLAKHTVSSKVKGSVGRLMGVSV